MIKLSKYIDMFPSGESEGYTVLVQDTEGDYYTVDTGNFQDAYNFKRIMEELPFGKWLEIDEELFDE